ncbi:hypothetical protein KOW79_004857 [Hemibagrus wyckioides]|uniref:NADH dehydrogenase [ubiquinone] flavoprotein 3, mitochondrial n=1 Tax=Hemibagrus wyckioides TaxID=337641 RepID=A0A9D3STJ2_9TELE|nr:proteoglycan 4 [Hemibagrus wyckioides]KAG7330888.1 hypothetical protein KOW79_004857 [Hemibagrus wyckioides]
MATSLLRLGRLGTLKCLRQDGWGSVRTPLSAAFCTKTEAPKKPTKKASTLEAPDERAALLAYKTTVAFPTRVSTPGSLSQGVAIGEYEQSGDPVPGESTVATVASTPQVSCEALSEKTITTVDAKQAEPVTDASVKAETESCGVGAAAETPPVAETSRNKDATSPTSADEAPKDDDDTSSSSSSSDSDSDSDSDDEKPKTEMTKPEVQTEDKAGQEEMPSATMEEPTSGVKTGDVPKHVQPSVPEDSPKGSPVGETEGSPVGETEGSPVGETEGSPVGETEGSPVGETEGSPVRATEGSPVRATEGSPVRATEGSPVRATEGSPVRAPEVREEVTEPTSNKVPASSTAAASSEEIVDPAPVLCTAESVKTQAEIIPEKKAGVEVKSSKVSDGIPEPVTDSAPSVAAKPTPEIVLESATKVASEPKVEIKPAPETTEAVAAAEELVDTAPVITDAEEVRAEPEAATAPEEAAPAPEPEPFDNTTYKNLQHHNYNIYTFVDMDVEMAKQRLPQPSTGRPSPRH